MDVIPYVSADGYTIQMTIVPSLLEFLGYDDPGKFIIQRQIPTGAAAPVKTNMPLPHFRLRQATVNAAVWDGQTIVIGPLPGKDIKRRQQQSSIAWRFAVCGPPVPQ